VLQPAGPADYPPSSEVTDIIALPGTGGRSILAVVGWAGYSDPPGDREQRLLRRLGQPGSFTRITPTGDINPATIGRTTLSASGGWLYAVLTTRHGDLRGQGAFVSKTGRAQGPWTRIADVDKLYNSDSALGPSDQQLLPRRAGRLQPVHPGRSARPPARLPAAGGGVRVHLTAAATWLAVGPYWNFDISCEEATGDPYACPPTTHPDQHAGMLLNGEFWAGNDGGLWRRPAAWHERGRWTNLNPTLYTLQNYSVAVGPVGSGLAYWGGLQDNGESYTRTDMSRIEQAFTGDGGDTIVDPNDGNKGRRGVRVPRHVPDHRRRDSTLREISPSCLTATDPPAECDPSPRFIAPIEQDVTNPDHWVAGGRYVWDDTKAWDTVCDSAACDWKQVYDTGAGHSITGMANNGAVTYAGWCGPCNPGQTCSVHSGPGDQLRRHVA
jgi:hypothetical protein